MLEISGTDPTDFDQFVSAPINATSLDTTTKNPVILDTVFKEKLLQIIADSLTNSGAIQSASRLTITAVYLVWVPARRLVSNTDNHRSLQSGSGSWELVIEHEVIVDNMAAANEAVTTIKTEASGQALETAIVEAYASDPNNTINMSVVETAEAEIVTVNGVAPSTKDDEDNFDVEFGASFPFAFIIFMFVLYLVYSPWMKSGHVDVQSNVFFWKSTSRKYIEIKRGILYAFDDDQKNSCHCEIALSDTELVTTEFDQSLAPWSLQLVKATPVSDSAYLQVTVGDSVRQQTGVILLKIQCENESDYQNWHSTLNAHVNYSKSPFRQWTNYYIVNPFVAVACCCFIKSTAVDSSQLMMTSGSNAGKI